MSPWGVRRRADEDEIERARARLSATRPRGGWVPRVPEAVRDAAMLGVRAEKLDLRGDGVGAVDGGKAGDGAEGGDVPEPGGLPGRHRAAPGGVVADRLPVPLRVLAESLPAGVRGGEAGLGRMHAVVLGVVILAGLGVGLVSCGLGRPDVTPVAPDPGGTVLATGTPVAAAAGESAGGRLDGSAGGRTDGSGAPDGSSDVEVLPDVVVHVAGKVARPGIVELPSGSRVVDALEAAGGADDGVDLAGLNLARILVDGEQVAVGIEPAPASQPPGDAAEPVVDLNAASAGELETLPGIGPALAANIVAWREEHGRFTVVDELLEVSGIGPAKLAALADRITL